MNFLAVAPGVVYGTWYGLMICLFSDIALLIRDLRWKEEADQAGVFLMGFGAMAERSDKRKPLLEIVVSSIIYAALFVDLARSHFEIRDRLFLFVLVSYGLLASLMDIRRHLILLPFNLAGAVLGVLLGIWRGTLWMSAVGGGVNLLVMCVFFWLGKKGGISPGKLRTAPQWDLATCCTRAFLGCSWDFRSPIWGSWLGRLRELFSLPGSWRAQR